MKGNNQKNTNQQIKKIQIKREERRIKMQEAKKEREQKKAINEARGKNVDIDFEIMIQKNKFKEKILSAHTSSADLKLAICVRKRPIFKKQQQNGQIDSISCANPQIKVHQPKFKVDGITKYVQNHTFTFDNTFNEEQSNQEIYNSSLKPLVPLLLKNGVVTCFAYGQTGSGKTYTMNAIQEFVVKEMFDMIKKNFTVTVSFFQIYGGRCLDLLNEKAAVNIMEDGSGNIQIQQLTQKSCGSAKQLLQIMSAANATRTTHATVANDTSSRSHAICQIFVKRGNEEAKLVLVDLAGSERAQDTQSNNRQRRMQGAEINKSLLALKECIRAMGDKADHVPFRASKLTLILRDSFISKQQLAKVVMIACISPGSSSADHSLNTLRYADRLKDNKQQHQMFNKMVQEMNKKNENIERDYEIQKQHLQKINSSKNIKKDEKQKKQEKKQENKSTPQNQKASITPTNKVPSKSNVPSLPSIPNIPNLPSIKKKQQQKKVTRVVSVKKTGASNKSTTNNSNSTPKKEQLQDNQIHQEINGEDEGRDKKKKIKEDVNLMKQTMTNANKEEYFAFQEKVADILQEQEQVFATHMAAIKQDAKLLTQESELISKVQGVGYVDYDVDSYVQKLQQVIKKKLKIYSILNKKLDKFKGALKQEDEIRHKVKDTFYY